MHALDGDQFGNRQDEKMEQKTLGQTHPVAESKEEPAEKNPQK